MLQFERCWCSTHARGEKRVKGSRALCGGYYVIAQNGVPLVELSAVFIQSPVQFYDSRV